MSLIKINKLYKKKVKFTYQFSTYFYSSFYFKRPHYKLKKVQEKYNLVRPTIGLCIYRTVNNFYLICLDFTGLKKKILYFISGGILLHTKQRNNRTNFYTVQLCSRKVSYFIKKKKQQISKLFLINTNNLNFQKSSTQNIKNKFRYFSQSSKKDLNLFLILFSFIHKSFLKSVLKGLKFHKVFFTKIYDRRRLAHNGCLSSKIRRI